MTNLFHGHRWTLEPHLRTMLRPIPIPPTRRIRAPFVDSLRGEIAITGRLGPEPTNGELLLVIHGLGGSTASDYMALAVAACRRIGIGCLRMNMRGADRSGDDVYHGGLAEDVGRLLGSPELAAVKNIYVLGYSLGGHLALSYGAGEVDPRVRAIASVCAPLDFETGSRLLDRPSGALYRRHLLGGLREVHGAAHARLPLHVGSDRVRKIRFLREWDDVVVAPRFGFRSAEHYYASVSVGPLLSRITTPTMMFIADHDPLVRLASLLPSLDARGTVQVVRSRLGGHVGFPPKFAVGLGHDGTFEDQILGWLRSHRARDGDG